MIAAGTAHKAGPEGEARHGINLADAVGAAGVPHLIYVSGAGAERPTGVPPAPPAARMASAIRTVPKVVPSAAGRVAPHGAACQIFLLAAP